MSDMPLNTLVTPAPAGQGPWPTGGLPGAGTAPGVRPGGELPGEGPEAGENPFSSLMLGFFQAAQASPLAAGPAAAGGDPAALAGGLAAQPATASLATGVEADVALATGNGNGKALPPGGAGLPLPPGLAAAAGAGADGVSGAPGRSLATAALSSLTTGAAAANNHAAPDAGASNGTAGTTPPLSSAATATVQGPSAGVGAGEVPMAGIAGGATGGTPPVPGAELLAQIRLARAGSGNEGNVTSAARLNPATAGATPPGGLAPAAGTLARLLGGDLAGNGTSMTGSGTPGLALGPELALAGETPPGLGPDGELISQFALDTGRRADAGSMLITGNTGTAGQPSPGTTSSVLNPTAGALPPLPASGDQAAWSRAVGERLMALQGQGLQSARLKLYPEYLGELDVRIRIEEGQAQVWFHANHAQAREAIEASLPKLKEMFAESGLDLVQAQVDSGAGDGSPRQGFGDGFSEGFGEGFRDGFRGDSRGSSLPGWASLAARAATTGPGGSGADAFTAQGTGRLNVLA